MTKTLLALFLAATLVSGATRESTFPRLMAPP